MSLWRHRLNKWFSETQRAQFFCFIRKRKQLEPTSARNVNSIFYLSEKKAHKCVILNFHSSLWKRTREGERETPPSSAANTKNCSFKVWFIGSRTNTDAALSRVPGKNSTQPRNKNFNSGHCSSSRALIYTISIEIAEHKANAWSCSLFPLALCPDTSKKKQKKTNRISLIKAHKFLSLALFACASPQPPPGRRPGSICF